jgi:hypothetical protein
LISFCFLFFDGNDKYYRRDNNHPDASGQYYDDFGHLSKRRLVPFGIFRRAKEKREIAVGQFFKTRLVNQTPPFFAKSTVSPVMPTDNNTNLGFRS